LVSFRRPFFVFLLVWRLVFFREPSACSVRSPNSCPTTHALLFFFVFDGPLHVFHLNVCPFFSFLNALGTCSASLNYFAFFPSVLLSPSSPAVQCVEVNPRASVSQRLPLHIRFALGCIRLAVLCSCFLNAPKEILVFSGRSILRISPFFRFSAALLGPLSPFIQNTSSGEEHFCVASLASLGFLCRAAELFLRTLDQDLSKLTNSPAPLLI